MEPYIIFLIVNAVIGLMMFEYSWYQMKAIREVNEERDSKYPAFRRYDAKHWQKWKFYFGALTYLPIRFCLVIAIYIVLFIVQK